MKNIYKLITFVVLLVGLFLPKAWPADVVMTVIARNSTDEKKEKLPIRQDLPSEVKKEDVLNADGMQILFDADKSVYYLYAESDLNPDETKNFKIAIRDVWRISDEQIIFLKSQADIRLKAMETKPNYQAGQEYHDKLIAQLDQIGVLQENQRTDINSRIDSYRVNTQQMNDLRQVVTLPDDFEKAAEQDAEIQKERKIIKFIIEVKNPSETDSMDQVEIIRYLPQGVKPLHIVDTKGFQIKYDAEKLSYFIARREDLKPGEKKRYEVQILDVWRIPDTKQDALHNLAQELTNKTVGTAFSESAKYAFLEIENYLAEIKDSQSKAVSPIDKIALFGINLRKVDAINAKIEELRKMVETLERSNSKDLIQIIKSITPDVAATWKFIFWTIGFLTVISTFFFFLWWGQTQAKQTQKVEMQELFKDEKP